MLFIATAARADTQVKIVLPADVDCVGGTMRVYRWLPERDWPTLCRELPVGGDKSFSLALPDGNYGVEVNRLADAAIVALRVTHFRPRAGDAVELKAIRLRLSADSAGAPARLAQAAIRCLGPGELRWRSRGDAKPNEPTSRPATSRAAVAAAPDVIVSPDEPVKISCVADTDAHVLAVWKRVVPPASHESRLSELRFSDADADHEISVGPAEDAPPLRSLTASFRFADAEVTVTDALRGRTLLTNRDRALVSYACDTDAGQDLRFAAQGVVFDSKMTRLSVAGRLTANLLAAWISSVRNDGTWVDLMARRLYLCDATGRALDLSTSSISLRCTLHHHGHEFTDVVPAEVPIASATFRSEEVIADVTYAMGDRQVDETVKGSGWLQLTSPHFKMDVPAPLRARAQAYLRMTETIRDIVASACGRPGPASVYIKWRANGDNAESSVGAAAGGQRDLRMSLPFASLERFVDPFAEPDFDGNGDPFVAHEMLHAFGYQHGEAMTRLELLCEETYRRLRWRAVDTGTSRVW